MSFEVINKLSKSYSKYVDIFFQDEIQLCENISSETQELINSIMKKEGFTGKIGEVLSASYLEKGTLVEILGIGSGKRENFNKKEYRVNMFNSLKNLTGEILISSKEEVLSDANILSEITSHINYDFDKYKDKKKDKFLNLTLFNEKLPNLSETTYLNEAITLTKDLVNEQAEIMTPKKLSEIALEYGNKSGFEVEILDESQALKLGMHAFLAVGRASINKPCVIVMRYFGNKEDSHIYGLVGKGLTYDTGGLSLKPTDSMFEMKCDMGGSATVMGTMVALAQNKVKKNVVAVIAACENSISSKSYRPGDIVSSMNGKYIEIINTDAEGRLTLVDAITYITRIEKVSEIIDVATLTGGVVVALGHSATGVFSNNKEMVKKLELSSENWEENFWHLPIYEDYRKMVKSEIASVKNSTGRWASAPCAAAFIESFLENDIPWMHLDIAGTAFLSKNENYHKKGATGVAVQTLYTYIKN
ncbi:MAG: leucyl aminopeptidase [Fusobacteriaceae bacterium]